MSAPLLGVDLGGTKIEIAALARDDGRFLLRERIATPRTGYDAVVRAIVALTESGATPLWMSRIRSDIPIYAFTRHPATQRRVTLYRGVYPVDIDVTQARAEEMYPAIFDRMLKDGLAAEGDLIIVTKGEFSGVSGGTNTMKIIQVQRRLA
mgnify:CR=1 FL=1